MFVAFCAAKRGLFMAVSLMGNHSTIQFFDNANASYPRNSM